MISHCTAKINAGSAGSRAHQLTADNFFDRAGIMSPWVRIIRVFSKWRCWMLGIPVGPTRSPESSAFWANSKLPLLNMKNRQTDMTTVCFAV